MISERVVGIGVLGAGRIGGLHARNVAQHAPGGRLVAVADLDLAAAKRAVDGAGQGYATDDPAALLDDPAVDAVVIALPTDMHAAHLVKAARKGKHVFCEKPIALSLQATRAAIEAVRASGVLVQIGFNRRFDPSFAAAESAIRRGDIGTPWMVRLVGRDPEIAPMAYLRGSGGQFKDQAIHEYDLARWLVGRDVEEVTALGSVLIEAALSEVPDVDTSMTCLRFQGGALAVVESCRRCVYGYDVRFEVHGSEGGLLVAGRGGTGVVFLGPGPAVSGAEPFFVQRFADAFRDEIAHFVACVREGRQPSIGVDDGYAAMRVAVAAGMALRERRTVRLDEVTVG